MSLRPIVCSPIEPHGHCISHPCFKTFTPRNRISHLGKTFHTVQPRSKLLSSCGPRRKVATTCLACRSPFCTPRAGTSAHLPIGQRQGARLLEGISAWLSQAAHLRPRQVSAPSRRCYVFPDVLRTIVDANVHLLERVAHKIVSSLSNVCMLQM